VLLVQSGGPLPRKRKMSVAHFHHAYIFPRLTPETSIRNTRVFPASQPSLRKTFEFSQPSASSSYHSPYVFFFENSLFIHCILSLVRLQPKNMLHFLLLPGEEQPSLSQSCRCDGMQLRVLLRFRSSARNDLPSHTSPRSFHRRMNNCCRGDPAVTHESCGKRSTRRPPLS
jgi:hypothetical protein